MLRIHLFFPRRNISLDVRRSTVAHTLYSWISRQAILVKVAQENQKATDLHRMSVYDDNYTDYPINSYVLYTHPMCHTVNLRQNVTLLQLHF